MSALTKIGVVLLVVCSLLLSSGIVVFVNKVDHFKKLHEGEKQEKEKQVQLFNEMKAQYDLVVARERETVTGLNGRIDALKKEISDRDGKILELNGQITKLDQDKKAVEVALATMTQTLQGAQTQLGAAQEQIKDLRKIRDDLVAERHSLNQQLTDALAKVDALSRQVKIVEERNQGLRAQVQELDAKFVAIGVDPKSAPRRTSAGTPTLEGVVNTVFNAGGKSWASISIGSKDNVTKDMKFNIINDKEFLGYLTIQTIEPNEAAGVLEGPKVERIKTGDLVKTQLQ